MHFIASVDSALFCLGVFFFCEIPQVLKKSLTTSFSNSLSLLKCFNTIFFSPNTWMNFSNFSL